MGKPEQLAGDIGVALITTAFGLFVAVLLYVKVPKLIAGALPEGLSLDRATGSISGTARDIGTSTFTVRVVDAAQATGKA